MKFLSSKTYNSIEISDLEVVKNPKVLMLIFLYLFSTKDSLYFFLVRLNKNVGIAMLQKHYSIIDKYLPFRHNEILELQ